MSVPDSSPPAAPPIASIVAWSLTVPAAVEDAASGLVWTAGCTGVTIEKASPQTVRLVCFYDDPEEHEGEIQRVAAEFGSRAERIQVPNPDWVKTFKETFVTFDVPPFRIVPEWVAEPPREALDRSPFIIRIDPGRAFGTGAHESTRLCLQMLGAIAGKLPKDPSTLDLGCGTGILGIAAIRSANARVTACDQDPLALDVARKHARLNNVNLKLLQMDGCSSLRPGQFDLVLANLMAPFLISRAAEITAMGAPGCRFILAGLLREEEEAVKAAWPSEWPVSATHLGEWASLRYEKP